MPWGTIIPYGSTWTGIIGSGEADPGPTGWTDPGFDDSGWDALPLALYDGYDFGHNGTPWPGPSGDRSAFVRRHVCLDIAPGQPGCRISIHIDDNYALYWNGVLVASTSGVRAATVFAVDISAAAVRRHNMLAIRAEDVFESAYFDVQVQGLARAGPCPPLGGWRVGSIAIGPS